MSAFVWLQAAAAAAIAIPLGLDLYMPVPEDNRPTAERIELGRRLFNDRRLSRDGRVSCASCHRPSRAFADGRRVAVGIEGRAGRRNAPALINRGYGTAFFWDARSTSLEDQVLRPIEDPNEMDSTVDAAAVRVGLNRQDLSRALASYVRSIVSGSSRFDRWVNGERGALSADEQRGLAVFRTKGNCTACHVGPTFTDERLHNTGIAWRGPGGGTLDAPSDPGGGAGAFKTPTLREIARSAPYMHDGSLTTLEDVVAFYDRGGQNNPFLDDELRPLKLTADERLSLVKFLRALSGEVREGARLSAAQVPLR
jgi:cytochrome c peroxidase